ncbi:MAG: triose-phosphate isomerase [Leptospiraceae bacterium]|nr:triose-phosphate isomerase [Leptospiraceae bacterium]MDW7976119.1 triose-phosphate isomerase [Leptospiraceae bacterium]
MRKTRIPLIAANWKMYKTPKESLQFLLELQSILKPTKSEVLICAPYTSLLMLNMFTTPQIKIGAQDLHWEEEGAYTGKVSAKMIKDSGCDYVIIGHSEQRTYFYETDETVNKKIRKALEHNLTPIVCVGETLKERDENQHMMVVERQVIKAFENIKDIKETVIAYEPVWAIGTGRNATPEQAQEMQSFIREIIKKLYGQDKAEKMRILYGGSLKPENAKEIFSQPDIDGGLIGGASLKVDSYHKLILAYEELL